MKQIKRDIRVPEGSFFLFGPRGTGKSTFVKTLLNRKSLYLDFLDPETFRTFSAFPELLIKTVQATNPEQVVIDEIQKVPQIIDVVHKLIEENGIRFIMTGSSARKLKKSGAGMLGGRAAFCTMHPFTARELGASFSFERSLQTGLIPIVEQSADRGATLSSYITMYLREEILAEGLLRNLGSFSRFLEMISFSHGSVLNVSNLSRECQIGRNIVTGYLDIMEDLLLAYRLNVFDKRAKRKTASHPKFYLFDNGLYRRLRVRGLLDMESEISGPALEGLVGQHLRALIDYSMPEVQLRYWRSMAGNEVDFILYGPNHFSAIEVKNTNVIRPSDCRGLTSFGDDYPEASLFLLYRGNLPQRYNQILVLPVELFLGDPLSYLKTGLQ